MVLGVTGSIGAGKSTVCNIFREKNIPVIDADKIGHEVLTYEEVKKQLFEKFGNVFDKENNVDRQKLSSLVFNNKDNLNILNNITHPIIKNKIKDEIAILKENNSFIVCEIPLLFECGWEDLVDKTLLVYISKEETIKRLIKRGMTEKDAILRYNSQMSIEKKLKKADFLINNKENLQKLAFKLAKVFNI